jgi:hypothetical protein
MTTKEILSLISIILSSISLSINIGLIVNIVKKLRRIKFMATEDWFDVGGDLADRDFEDREKYNENPDKYWDDYEKSEQDYFLDFD